MLTHLQYQQKWLGRKVDVDHYPPEAPYQCVDLAKSYCKEVRGYIVKPFGGTAYNGRKNRAITFSLCDAITGFAAVPTGSIAIFKPYALIKHKKPGALFWKTERLTSAGHVGVVDYIDNSGVIRLLEQNGTGNGQGINGSEIRLWGYSGKDIVAGFILQPKMA